MKRILSGLQEALRFAEGDRRGCRIYETTVNGYRKVTDYDADNRSHAVYRWKTRKRS